MTKESGIGMTIGLDDATPALQQIESDVLTWSFSTPRGVKDVTGVNSAGVERLLLLADMQATLNGEFDVGANLAHAVLKTVPSTDAARTLTLIHSAQTLTGEGIVSDYALNRAADGSLSWTAPWLYNATTAPAWS